MNTHPHNRSIAIWLLVIAALLYGMIVLGGVTRLTRSGLSIVEWKPVVGTLPPTNETQWHEEFDKYKQSPEYHKVNSGMSLGDFKEIFWFEYAHRLLGRIIFFVALALVLWSASARFTHRAPVDNRLLRRLIAVPLLIALNGALGWFMVTSGLQDNPRVSQYRLTAHLALATSVYGYVLWIALGLLQPSPESTRSLRLRRMGIAVTTLVFAMIVAGGFVAGTHAGFTYNTFPLMNGHVVPAGIWSMEPWWRNLFENVATVQFNHRMLAYALLILIALYWLMARRETLTSCARLGFTLLIIALAGQVTLGIATLLLVVPVTWAAAHQAGAILLFSAALYLNHRLRLERRRH